MAWCKYYFKDLTTQKRSCDLGLSTDMARSDDEEKERWLPRHFLPCIPNAQVHCSARIDATEEETDARVKIFMENLPPPPKESNNDR